MAPPVGGDSDGVGVGGGVGTTGRGFGVTGTGGGVLGGGVAFGVTLGFTGGATGCTTRGATGVAFGFTVLGGTGFAFGGTVLEEEGADGLTEVRSFAGGDTVGDEDGFGEVGGGGVVGPREGVEGIDGCEEEGSVVVLGLGLHVSLLVGVGDGGADGDPDGDINADAVAYPPTPRASRAAPPMNHGARRRGCRCCAIALSYQCGPKVVST